jgi:hypothetical protein
MNLILKQRPHRTDALARYKEKLEALPPTGTGYHPALLGVATLGVMSGLSEEEIFSDLREHTDERARRVKDSEIMQAIEKAMGDGSSNTKKAGEHAAPIIRLPYTPAVFRRRLIESGRKFLEQDFISASSMHLSGHPADDSLCVLDAFYSANEYLFIGNRFYKEVHLVAKWRELLLDTKAAAEFVPHMEFIIPNPVTGQEHKTKDGRLSKRCDTAIKDYRFVVAEFDTISQSDQLAFWASVPLPVAALIDSGGKSIHAWIKLSEVFAPGDWQQTVKDALYRQILVPMGLDPACSNPARLSRFPGHYREEKGRWQRLLYINQHPNPKGIFKD